MLQKAMVLALIGLLVFVPPIAPVMASGDTLWVENDYDWSSFTLDADGPSAALLLAALMIPVPMAALEPASLSEPQSPVFVASTQGTLGMMPVGDWATPIAEADMQDVRGGFNGLAFNVYFTGSFENLQAQASGQLTVGGGAVPGTTNAPPPNFSVQDGQVQISTVIGNFQGASGIFQIAQVPGSFNVVHNNLFIQIALVNVLNNSPIPNLATLFGAPK
jgi:hypothetical protein